MRSLCAAAVVLAAGTAATPAGAASPVTVPHQAPRAPAKAPQAPALPSGLSALSWVVADATTGDVLASKAPHRHLPPASTLKTLFALTVLPKLPAEQLHTVSASDLDGIGDGSSRVGIEEGHAYRVADLWRGVFLRSGGDAVHVLAAMNGGVQKTISDMRQRAEHLGAEDTQVMSVDGYDTPGQYSSAYDLALFGRAGLSDPAFATYCSTGVAAFPADPDKSGLAGSTFEIQNTNRLLTGTPDVSPYPGLIGIKNGYTTLAGNTLIAAAHHGNRTLIVTVMNPQAGSVYEEARSLLDWGFAADDKVQPVGTLRPAEVNPAVLHPADTVAQPVPVPLVGDMTHSGGDAGLMSPAGMAVIGALVVSLAGSLWLMRRRMRR